MRFSTIVAALVGTTGVIAHSEPQSVTVDDAELASHGGKPSRLWPKPL